MRLTASMDSDSELDFEFEPDNDDKGDVKTDESVQVYQHEATGFRVSVRLVHQVHGFLNGQGATPASLIVLKFKLTDTDDDPNRRFKRFYVELRFAKDPKGDPADDPYVKAYEPAGKDPVYLSETFSEVTNTITYGVDVKAGAPPPVKLEADFNASRTKENKYSRKFLYLVQADRKETEEGGGRKGQDIVYWNLRENSTEKVGVGAMTVAVLVARKKGQKFTMRMALKATVDLEYSIASSRLWKGKNGKKLPFDPYSLDTQPPLADVDKEQLGAFADSKSFLQLSDLHVPEKYVREPSINTNAGKAEEPDGKVQQGAQESGPRVPLTENLRTDTGQTDGRAGIQRRYLPSNVPMMVWAFAGVLALYLLSKILEDISRLLGKT
jgi:hypothetical protein